MNEKELRTSPKQRIFIILIAIFMVGSIIASYVAIVVGGVNSGRATASSESGIDQQKVAEYQEAYDDLQAEFSTLTQDDFDEFIKYKSEITGYNESTANDSGVVTKDLKTGTGAEITEGNTDYLAYYVGWCGDESIFDSSFNDNKNPTKFIKILDASLGMIEGWNQGVEGMKIEGIREITVPSNLAYGETMEVCGGTNKPLKFMVMAKEKTGELAELAKEIDEAYMRLQYAQYGVDYDSVKNNQE